MYQRRYSRLAIAFTVVCMGVPLTIGLLTYLPTLFALPLWQVAALAGGAALFGVSLALGTVRELRDARAQEHGDG